MSELLYIRMELVLLLSTLIQRFVLSVPEGYKLPSGQLSGNALLVQPEEYKLVLTRRREVFEHSAGSEELCTKPNQTTALSCCRKTKTCERGI